MFSSRATIYLAASFFLAVFFYFGMFIENANAAATLNKPTTNFTGLVAYWSMDGADYNSASTTAEVLDKSGNGNNGDAQNGPVRAEGKIGQALKFDGTDDVVSIGSVFSATPTAFSLTAWVNRSAFTTGMGVVSKSASGNGYSMNVLTSAGIRRVRCTINGTDVLGTTTSQDNQWYFLACTWDGSTLKAYKDGIFENSGSVSSITNPSTGTLIGKSSSGGAFWTGLIDEVRIYNRPLSDSEIFRLYSSGKVKINGSKNSSQSTGLIGLWSFDGADYNSASTTAEALDRSGNGYNGDVQNGPTLTEGKIGQGLSFSSSNHLVNTGTDMIGTNAVTACMWVFPRSTVGSQGFLYNNKFQFYTSTNNRIGFSSDGTTFILSNTNALTQNVWQYICVSRTAAGLANLYVNAALSGAADRNSGTPVAGTSNVIIGNRSGADSALNGIFDDVRIYNRVLSLSEIKQLYNTGNTPNKVNASQNSRITNGLVGLWSFNGPDYNSASTTAEVLDRSGSNNNGDATNGPALTEGKAGQGFSFDGVDDHINLGTMGSVGSGLGSGFTFAGWFYRKDSTARGLFSSINGSNVVLRISMNVDSAFGTAAGRVALRLRDNSGLILAGGSASGFTVPLNTWTHIVITGQPSTNTVTVYFNGTSQTVSYNSQQTPSSFSNFTKAVIGADQNLSLASYYNANMDEVRFYNRVLTAAEVQQLYNLSR